MCLNTGCILPAVAVWLSGLYWKGDEGEFCFIRCLKTQTWNIHHKEKNQVLSCKNKKKQTSRLWSGFSLFIFNKTFFWFCILFSMGSYNCSISNQLRRVKKKNKKIKGSLKDSVLLTVLFCLYLIFLMVFRWL